MENLNTITENQVNTAVKNVNDTTEEELQLVEIEDELQLEDIEDELQFDDEFNDAIDANEFLSKLM